MDTAGRISPLKRPAPDGGSTPPAKKACSNHEIASDGEIEVVEFINSRGEKFTVTLSPALQENGLRGYCPICREKRLTAYSVCSKSALHVVCGTCMPGFLANAQSKSCPLCRADNDQSDSHLHTTITLYKWMLERREWASFICAACSRDFSFSQMETHSHCNNIPSEDPFCYDPGITDTTEKPQIMSDENLEKITDSIVSQLQKCTALDLLSDPYFIILRINRRTEQLHMVGTCIKPFNKTIPDTINLFKSLFKISFRYRECNKHPLTLQALQESLEIAGYPELANSLTWPVLDESSTPPAKITGSDNKTGPDNREETVEFVNSMGEKFTVTLSPAHQTRGHCTVCLANKLAVYPTCTIDKRHIACGTCISKLLLNAETTYCPSCNTESNLPDNLYINAAMKIGKQELENTGFICALCPLGFSFSEMKEHGHRNPPSANPFCYDPTLSNTTKISRISNKKLERTMRKIVLQIKKGAISLIMAAPDNFLKHLNDKFPELLRMTQGVSAYNGPMTFPSDCLLELMLTVSFRCRELSHDPLTLQELQEALRNVGEQKLADSLTWPDV